MRNPDAAHPRYFDRELSWLEFNQRVLNEALDPQVPLLERLKFLAITSSNLDEFHRVRVGTLSTLATGNISRATASGLTPHQQLRAVRERIGRMVRDQYHCYLTDLIPRLTEAGLQRLLPEQLNATQKMMVRQVFEQQVFSVVTPMAIGADTPFPLLPNQMLSLCVRLAPLSGQEDPELAGNRFAIIPCGRALPRFFTVPSEKGTCYMHLEDLVGLWIDELFPGEEIEEIVPFRVTRNAEVEVQELTPHGLAWNMADVLRARTAADCIRLEMPADASEATHDFLKQRLEIEEEEITRVNGPVDLGALMELAGQRGFENLRNEPWPPVRSTQVPAEELMFDIIGRQDVLLYHPYESFEPVVRFIEEAADDPDVIAIKQTLYRISRESPLVKALIRAVENGKHVSVLLELKARFDEERNLKQARELEAAGAQVIYGVKGLKTHAKLSIVVRRESHGIQRYMHFGTGNYNEVTARVYSDASLLTSNEDLGMDALAFFNAISGYSQPPYRYRKLAAAPLSLRETLEELIDAEIDRRRSGDDAEIALKLNAVTDPVLIEKLYAASQAGVRVLMNIRGICCLKPGVPGLSENIRVVSVVDRYLEHARILRFHRGGDPQVFISSADWMNRNLDHRKELLVPVEDEQARQRLISILDVYFSDNLKSWELQPDGAYSRVEPGDEPPLQAQAELYRQSRETVTSIRRRQRTAFEPHRPEA